WLFNYLNIYLGIQPIQLASLATDRRPFDMAYLGGLSYFYPVNNASIAFAGYQIDRLNTEAPDFRSLNNTVFAGYRQGFTENLFGTIGGRIRIRNLDIAPDDTRFSGNVNLQYLLNQWLTLQLNTEY